MGLFSKAKRAVGKIAKPIIKPFQKISDKFLPNELRPFLPYATMFLPGSGILGAMGGAGGFAKMYAANMLSQAMGDPEAEFEDLSQLSGILSGAQGALSGPTSAADLRGMKSSPAQARDLYNTMGGPGLKPVTESALKNRSLLTKTGDLGLEGLAKGSEYLTGNIDTLQNIGSGEIDLFTKEGAKAAGRAIAPDFIKASADTSLNIARPAMRKFIEDDLAEQAQIEETTTADESERATLQMKFMRQAGIPEETVEETLIVNDLGDYYEPPVEAAAQGGIIGLKEGGMLNFGGREMDLRTGGFVPIGRKERADDVPARLSKNEFVMTADAVRAAGGGSVNEGAKRMYEVMNNLEARA